MALDLASELIAALRSSDGMAAVADAVRGVVADEVRRVLAEQGEQLRPLNEILSCSRPAANARLARDPGLRALGVPVGRRLLFRRSDVEAYLKTRGRGEQ